MAWLLDGVGDVDGWMITQVIDPSLVQVPCKNSLRVMQMKGARCLGKGMGKGIIHLPGVKLFACLHKVLTCFLAKSRRSPSQSNCIPVSRQPCIHKMVNTAKLMFSLTLTRRRTTRNVSEL